MKSITIRLGRENVSVSTIFHIMPHNNGEFAINKITYVNDEKYPSNIEIVYKCPTYEEAEEVLAEYETAWARCDLEKAIKEAR